MVYNAYQSKQIAVMYAIDLTHEKFNVWTKSLHSQNSHVGHSTLIYWLT